MKYIISAAMLVVLLFTFSTASPAQEKSKKEGSKSEMTKSSKEMGPVKSVTCDPACGFCVKSRNEKELISMVKTHAKTMHKMTMTDAKVKEMMKVEDESGAK